MGPPLTPFLLTPGGLPDQP
uniref:Uncharacterized protein n=1 Tax=Anguilla anguilla TaxID=7936 RepID=A0A0E9USP7_ANGAN